MLKYLNINNPYNLFIKYLDIYDNISNFFLKPIINV